METKAQLWSYLAQFFLEWEMLQAKVVENIKTHVLDSIMFSRQFYRVWDTAEKYLQPNTDDNMALEICMLGT